MTNGAGSQETITVMANNDADAWMNAYSYFGYGATVSLVTIMWGRAGVQFGMEEYTFEGSL